MLGVMSTSRQTVEPEPFAGRPDALLRMLMEHPDLTPADSLPRVLDLAVASLGHRAA